LIAPAEVFDLHADGEPPTDPVALARQWLPPDEEPDRPRATLATVGLDGYPAARTVLLTAVDRTGFAFHTSAGSRKTAELDALPRAALVLLWPELDRQLTVRGDVVADGPASLAAAWSARPDHLRRLAWLNTDELARLPLGERQVRWADSAAQGASPTPADSWVGYRLRPRELTFWATRPDAASRRLQYVREAQGWRWAHLAG
jgi:pyridoxamine 5'-phosphate oxidase